MARIFPNPFRYRLHEQITGMDVYLDSLGNLAYSSVPVPLEFTPDGWREKTIGFERDMDKLGLTESFTLPLNFPRDSAIIIQKMALQINWEVSLLLIIEASRYDLGFGGFVWDLFYQGELDLPKMKSADPFVTVPLMQPNLAKQLAANSGTQYTINIEDEDFTEVKMDGLYFLQSARWKVSEGVTNYGPNVPLAEAGSDGTAVFVSQTSEGVNQDEGFIANTGNTTFIVENLQGSIRFTPEQTTQKMDIFLYRISGTVGNYQLFLIQQNTVDPLHFGENYEFTYNIPSIPLAPGEWLRFVFHPVSFPDPVTHTIHGVTFLGGEITCSYRTKYPPTHVKCLHPFVLFKALVKKITGSTSAAVSSLLENLPEGQKIFITSGDAVRGLKGAGITTSLDEFFEHCKVIHQAGIGNENEKVVIEGWSHFLSTSTGTQLGRYKKGTFEWSWADELMFNKLNAGYKAKETDDVNGKLAFNNTSRWVSNIQKVAATKDLIAPYAADPIYIEKTRANLEGKTTTDNSADNDVMILNVSVSMWTATYEMIFGNFFGAGLVRMNGSAGELGRFFSGAEFDISGTALNNGTYTVITATPVGSDLVIAVLQPMVAETVSGAVSIEVAELYRKAYVNSAGMPDIATYFNIEFLTPRRIVERWLPYINSCLFTLAGEEFTFEGTDKNRELMTDDGTYIFDEDSSFVVGNKILFKNIYITSEIPGTKTMPAQINGQAALQFQMPHRGKNMPGFIKKAAAAPHTKIPQKFQLLLGPDADHEHLIGFG